MSLSQIKIEIRVKDEVEAWLSAYLREMQYAVTEGGGYFNAQLMFFCGDGDHGFPALGPLK
jgi:hypothetical protein